MFVTKTMFISEQIAEYRFGAFLMISDKFSTMLNVFSYMILPCWLHNLENFITILYDFEKHSGYVVLFRKLYLVIQKFICLRETDETFSNEERCEDNGYVNVRAILGEMVKTWGKARFCL